MSSGSNDGATKLNPASSVQGMSDEGQVISGSLGNSNHSTQTDPDVPITNIDDVLSEVSLCSDESTHIKSPFETLSNEAVSRCSSQPVVTLSEKAGLQAPEQSSPLNCSILDAEKLDEKVAILPVETPHVNQLNQNCSERPNTISTCMYPDSDDSDSTSDSSVMVNKMTDSGASLHEPSSDEEEVEICSGDAQQPTAGGLSSLRQSPTGSSHFQHASSQNTNLDQIFDGLQISSNVSLKDKENSVTAAQSLQHSQVFKVSSAEQPCQSSNSSVPVYSIESHIDSAIKPCDKVTACVASSPGGISIYSSSTLPDSQCVIQGNIANLHADISVTSDLLKHLSPPMPSLPSTESDTSGSNISRSETAVSAMKNKEKVLECRTNLNPHSSSSLLDNSGCSLGSSDFKLKVDSKLRSKTSSPKLKGLHIKSESKSLNGSFQKPTSSESAVLSNTKAAFNQPAKLPPVATISNSLKTSNQPDMNNCHALSKISDGRQVLPEHEYSGGTLQTVQLAKEKDVQVGSKAPAKSQGRSYQPSTQRTFIEVRLSSLSGSSSPVMARHETVNIKDSKHSHKVTDRLTPVFSPAISTVDKTNGMGSITEFNSLCSTKETPSSTTNNGSKLSPVETSETIKSTTSRLYIKTMERRSFSTDTALSAEYNPFSVRHKIKSFENLANFDKPVIKSSDSQSYALTCRASLNQRIAGYMGLVNSTDCQTRQRSSYVDNLLPATPYSPLLGKSPYSITLINLELPCTSSSTPPLTECNPEAEVQKVSDGIAPHTPPVLRRKHNKIASSRVRQLRALSMPDLEKLCTEDFTVVDKTQTSIPPVFTKATGTESLQPPATLTKVDVNRVSQGDSESTEDTPQRTPETHGQQPSWSVRWEALLRTAHLKSFLFKVTMCKI